MVILTKEKFDKLAEIEGWIPESIAEESKKWIEDPIYVWGGHDEKVAMNYLKQKGYKWEGGKELESFSPGWTWGYPAVLFIETGGFISYSPVEYGSETDEEPSFD